MLNSRITLKQIVLGPITKNRTRVVCAIFSTLIIVAVNLIEPQIIKRVIDQLISGAGVKSWGYLFIIWGTIFLIQHIALYGRIASMQWVASRSASELRLQLFERILGFPRVVSHSLDEADLAIAVTRDIDDLEPLWGQFPLSVLWYAITIVGALGFAVLISLKLTLFILGAVIFMTCLAHWVERRVLLAASRKRDIVGTAAALAKRAVHQKKLIQLYLAQAHLVERMRKLAKELEDQSIGLNKWHWLNQSIGDSLGFIALAGVLGIGGALVNRGEITVGSLVSFILYINMLGTAFVRLRSQMPEVTKGKIAAKRTAFLLNEEGHHCEPIERNAIVPRIEKLCVENVEFAYGKEGKSIFNNLTHAFNAGSIHVIYGRNGVGKSTLLDIISGYTIPESGSVLLNDCTLEDFGKHKYWSKCSVLLQEALVFDDTVEFNLWLGNPLASRDELIDSLIISRLAEDSDRALSMLHHRAEEMSTGQKRRLGIARAILRQSDIYLLDEPTANLDTQSCDELALLLRNLSKVSIVIVTTQQVEIFGDDCILLELEHGLLLKRR